MKNAHLARELAAQHFDTFDIFLKKAIDDAINKGLNEVWYFPVPKEKFKEHQANILRRNGYSVIFEDDKILIKW